jgi:predicted enzyme related to lactoylglutathione lyase
MPTRDAAPVGAPCWIDLFTSDPEKSKAFYGELFGWVNQDPGPDYGGYTNFLKDGVPVAGSMKNDGSTGTPDGWSVYLATEDAKATADAAQAKGAQVIVPPMDVMDLGAMAVFTDPGGAVIGAWQPGQHKGFGVLAEPGAPSWFELQTRDYEATVDFYRDVFGWDTHVVSDTPEFRYTTLGEGEGQQAGIMDGSAYLPEGVPPHWSIYFGVENTDKAVATIVALGGRITDPAVDTPYGRLAEAADPTGALFKLVQSPSES